MKNLYGFEFLIAPYTIAHLKLSQYLREQEHALRLTERLQVFLTNTLEPVEPQKTLLLPAVTAEVEAAQAVKEKPILVITGNPPYSGHAKNKGAWITAQIAKYREGFPDLSKPAQGKWLQDDYVKFIRFAQMKMDGGEFEFTDNRGNLQTIVMEGVDNGIVGVITNHSWIDNPTFKGMRRSLLRTFDQIYVLDLHGSAKKRESAPEALNDQNIFDIEQGVAISLFIKQQNASKGVWHADLWGKRIDKYRFAAQATKGSVEWTRIEPNEPLWLFKPYDADAGAAYARLWSLRDIFSPMGDPAPGIVTTHDAFAISFTPEDARRKVKALLSTRTEDEARSAFRLCTQEQWLYERAKEELPAVDLVAATREVAYRPFDNRWTIWDRNVAVHRRERVTSHMRDGNIALDVCRVVAGDWRHVLAIDLPPDDSVVSNRTKERGFVFPVRVNGTENLSAGFREFIDKQYENHYTPEEVIGYIYAVLHSPAYRLRYAEFLRMDFPRIPLPVTKAEFDRLTSLGWALIQAHLLRQFPRKKLATYHGSGDHTVDAVRYVPADNSIAINNDQFFKPVPQPVWEFHIGGYQVLDKYLKSRKGRKLSLDEINHVSAIADSLAFTIDQMAKIDAAYRSAFPDQG